jgi:hypothetical protein
LFIARATLVISLSLLEEGIRRGNSRSSNSAGAALNFRSTVGIFTDEFALRLGALRFVTFPVAFGFLADSLTLRLRSLAMSDTMGLLANSDTFRAVKHFATFIRALNFTFRLLTLYIANSILGFGA